MHIARFLKALLRDTRGTSAVEYGLILGLIVVGLFLVFSGVAHETSRMWNYVEEKSAEAHSGA
jgi:pilus assembly protein Flp/PilA